jgi:hypothetical protein
MASTNRSFPDTLTTWNETSRRDQIRHYMTLMGHTTKSTLYLKQQKDYVISDQQAIIAKNGYPCPPDGPQTGSALT